MPDEDVSVRVIEDVPTDVAVLYDGVEHLREAARMPPTAADWFVSASATWRGAPRRVFRGPLAAAGDCGTPGLAPGWRRRFSSSNLMWPADHAWFVATEIDLPWTGVGGPRRSSPTCWPTPGSTSDRAEPGSGHAVLTRLRSSHAGQTVPATWVLDL